MADREKVKKALEMCIEDIECTGCPYEKTCFAINDEPFAVPMMRDALALLKEQEAVEPYSMNAERTYGICPKCGKIVFRYGNVEENHYCGVCGQAVKWDAAD